MNTLNKLAICIESTSVIRMFNYSGKLADPVHNVVLSILDSLLHFAVTGPNNKIISNFNKYLLKDPVFIKWFYKLLTDGQI